MTQKHWLLLSAAVVLSACAAVAQAPAPAPQKLTLKQAETIAITNHPQIQAATFIAAAAKEVNTEVRSAYFPQVYGAATGADTNSAGSRVAAGDLTSPHVYQKFAVGTVVSQLITDFGRTHELSRSAGLRTSAEQAGVVVTRADVLLAVDQAYFGTLKAQAVLRVAQQTVQERQTVTDRVNALAQAKLKSGLDVSFAEVSLGQAKLLLVQAQNEVKAAYAELTRALGYSDEREYELAEEPLPPVAPPEVLPLVAEAFRERPELARQRFLVQSAHAFALAERDLYFPTISGLGVAGAVPEGDASVFRSTYAAGGVNLSIPIFNGKLFTARYAEANLRTQAEEQRLRDLEDVIAREVHVAWLDVITAYQRLDLTTQILGEAKLALDLADARYKLGLSSIVELEQAQLNETSAAIDQASAQYDCSARTAALNFAIGVLR
ncbi:MAG: TolC family protein [Terriglobales bacterium]